MDTQAEIVDFLTTHKQFLKEKYSISKIGLFGSFARNEMTKDSDVDLLIEIDKGTQNIYDLKTALKNYLSTAFKRDVDLARIKYLKPYAKKEILRDALYV